DTEKDPTENQPRQAVGEAHEHGRYGPDNGEDSERAASAELVRHPSARNLERKIWISEGGKNQPDLGVAQVKLWLQHRGGRAYIDPDDVVDEIHRAEQSEHIRSSCDTSAGNRPILHSRILTDCEACALAQFSRRKFLPEVDERPLVFRRPWCVTPKVYHPL